MNDSPFPSRFEIEIDRRWLTITLAAWAIVVAWYLWQRWNNIYWLSLGDTDDNMRLMQVRALLGGQGWYDLRQYRLNPPSGFDIHWSRLVDLPIAGLILILKPFLGTAWAERWACGIAPLLPLGVTMVGVALTVRRLVAPAAYLLAGIILFGTGASMTIGMYVPMRIDHHGWQLAMLSLTAAGLADPRRARGGATVGLATAVSLTIGLEMLPYGAMAGAMVTLRWVWDRTEARRLLAYALTLSGGSALGFVGFTSYANMAMRCDALTPVWLSVMVGGGALLFVLAWASPENRIVRLALAAAAGAVVAGAFAYAFPQCLGRPEGVSEELARTWLNNVREAKPIYQHPLRVAFPMAVLPVSGLIGAIIATWRARGTERFAGWVSVTLFVAFAAAMLLWQIRAGPAAALIGVIGATALAWIVLPWLLTRSSVVVRVVGSVAAFLLISGLFAGMTLRFLPTEASNARTKIVNRANARCSTIPAMRPLDRLPATVIFTHVDLGPRLITLTHHDAIAGPYHRNGDAILDVHHAFTGTADGFRAIAKRHGARLLLVCPNMAETTIYRSRAKDGFYGQLTQGKVPTWLVPVPLPKNSPFRLWRIDYD
ncbi:AcrB/AcrD/AcrF family protein [Sphingomonas cannabina]|uniref:AcrB/AcrD/AcrF family protein n=1 Tax=Sphingomonas cannabina TaxID=2899123 RepID=UPI001F2EE5F3|nr:AcrB/AcrD/AcrF family protein [Sphingomonas cannabina]UIJ46133.1 AcrB/AcrD/AcrF family protein [Sphingomonas cannabina]